MVHPNPVRIPQNNGCILPCRIVLGKLFVYLVTFGHVSWKKRAFDNQLDSVPLMTH